MSETKLGCKKWRQAAKIRLQAVKFACDIFFLREFFYFLFFICIFSKTKFYLIIYIYIYIYIYMNSDNI